MSALERNFTVNNTCSNATKYKQRVPNATSANLSPTCCKRREREELKVCVCIADYRSVFVTHHEKQKTVGNDCCDREEVEQSKPRPYVFSQTGLWTSTELEDVPCVKPYLDLPTMSGLR